MLPDIFFPEKSTNYNPISETKCFAYADNFKKQKLSHLKKIMY